MTRPSYTPAPKWVETEFIPIVNHYFPNKFKKIIVAMDMHSMHARWGDSIAYVEYQAYETGTVAGTVLKLFVSPSFLKMPYQERLKTYKHEIAHVLRGGIRANHDEKFKRIALAIGADPNAHVEDKPMKRRSWIDFLYHQPERRN